MSFNYYKLANTEYNNTNLNRKTLLLYSKVKGWTCTSPASYQLKKLRPLLTCNSSLTNKSKGFKMNKLLQNFNGAGLQMFCSSIFSDPCIAIPHLTARHIGHVDWEALHAAGFKGCVFDKDNTLTLPFAMAVQEDAALGLQSCQKAFGPNVALLSNSAGLEQYDRDGAEARHLEACLGIQVIRHKHKKPEGGCEEISSLFGCQPHEVIMVGDRYFTDILYGNRHGMLTVYVQPFNVAVEPKGVVLARKIEDIFMQRWQKNGLKAPAHIITENAVKGGMKSDKSAFLLST
mmetsp:Transcript_28936/g.53175  ORF Transcript_28936/g.53175 Transcript_28936/m.53175 type:complete len:289 (-) Transcript_28936:211-1077(-)